MCYRPEAVYLQEAYNRLKFPEDYFVIGACMNSIDLQEMSYFKEKMEFKLNLSSSKSLGATAQLFGKNFVAINADKIYTSARGSEVTTDELEQFILNAQTGITPQQPVSSQITLSSYPNPFNGSATVQLTLQEPAECAITVYNAQGAQVATLLKSGELAAGSHAFKFSSDQFPSGIYYARVKAGREFKVHRMNCLR